MAGLIEAGTYRLVSQDGLTEKDITIDNSGNPLFDNNKLLQESNMGNLKNQAAKDTSFTLSYSDSGKIIVSTSTITITLPLPNTMPSGTIFYIINSSGTTTISLNGNSTDAKSLILQAGHSIILQSDGGVFYRSLLDIRSNLNASGNAPIYACRAWVNFNGTGTVAIRASGNVSSVTDNGTGDYTVNFATAMPDANYAISTHASDDATMGGFFFETGTGQSTRSASLCRILWSGHSGAAGDRSACSFSAFR